MDRSQQQLFLLFGLLIFYCAAPFWVFFEMLVSRGPGGAIENDFLVKTLSVVAANPGAYTSVLNQMIVPVVAAVTAANYSNLSNSAGQKWLFILPLVTIFVCLADALLVNVEPSSFDIATTADGKAVNTAGIIAQLFLSSASTLAVYVMLLVGLKVGEKVA